MVPKGSSKVSLLNKRLRQIPYPAGSAARRRAIELLMRWRRWTYREALLYVIAANKRAKDTPVTGERCGARTRRGTPCQCKALESGRCKLHGGNSTGPKTQIGKRRSMANLPIRAGSGKE